ncbi:MAG: phasin family protein [Deferribacterales bacterium]
MAELKDLFYMGIGTAILAKEKIEAETKELLEKGKLTKEQQKEFMDKAAARGKEEEKALNDKLKEVVREVINEMGLATKDDIEELKKLIKEK